MLDRRFFLGIDCGLHGAIAAIDDETNTAAVFDVCTDPRNEAPHKLVHFGNHYAEERNAELILKLVPSLDMIAKVVIEEQQTMGNEGLVSAFKIGYGLSMWITICKLLKLPFELLLSTDWKPRMVPVGSGKKISRARAALLFPNIEPMLLAADDHDRAEAILIAEDGRRRYKKEHKCT